MTMELICKDSGKLVVEKNVSEFLNGHKWYWIEYENGVGKKLSAEEYQLLSVEA